jgi:hypothetical protein
MDALTRTRSSTFGARTRRWLPAIACVAAVFALGAPASALAAVRYVDDTGGVDGVNSCTSPVAPCLTIQHAVNQAVAGDTVNLAAGTYSPGAVIDKANLTISGAGTATTHVIPTALLPRTFDLRGSADGVTIEDLRMAGPYTGAGTIADRTGVHVPNTIGLNVAGLTLRNLAATGFKYAIDVRYPGSATGWTLDSVDTRINEYGARFTGATMSLSVTASHFDFSNFGLYVGHTGTTPRTPGVFDGVEIADTTFDGNATKGLYFEQGSNMNLHGLSVTTPPPPSPRADVNPNNGIDVNVKYGPYANIRIADSVFSGATEAGLLIHGRNDGALYSPVPGSLDNVDLEHLTVTGNSAAPVNSAGGINVSTATTNVSVTGSRIVGNGSGGLVSFADPGPGSTIAAAGNWWGCNEGPTGDSSNNCSATIQTPGLGTIDAGPWLVLSASANSADIAIGGATSDVTAALTTNSAGDPASPPPDGPTVGFATDLGTVSPAGSQLVAGEATSVFTSGAFAGTAHVTASLDSAVVTADVEIVAPPVATVPPAVSGDAIVGSVLSCFLGEWTGDDLAYERQWLRDGVDILGESGITYTTAGADIGHAASCRVTATNTVGTTVSETSDGITVLPALPASIAPPVLSGAAVVAGRLSCSLGTWTGDDLIYERQWQRDGVDIPGQTAVTYAAVEADAGRALGCRITATNAVGASVSQTSNQVIVLAPVREVADTVPPVLSAVRLSQRRFPVGRHATPLATPRRLHAPGTVIAYRLSESATVTFAIERTVAGRSERGTRRCITLRRSDRAETCRRYWPVGTLTRQAKSGSNTLDFSGRVDARALRPGRYRLTVQAADAAGNRSRATRRHFTVVR